MEAAMINAISDYVMSHSRNKVVFHSKYIYELETVNIGLRISERIYNLKEPSRISMRVSSELNDILNSSISNHELLGKYLSIGNIGILFEPELKIDFARLLDNFSQNNVLLVKWDGEIDTENIYFLSKESGIKTNIKSLSHIAL